MTTVTHTQAEAPAREGITVTDLKAVYELNVPMPAGGGLTMIEGTNESGKSSTLEGIHQLAGGKPNFPLRARRGSLGGKVEGFGLLLTAGEARVNRKQLVMGDPQLIGGVDIGVLIDPKLKSPEAADRARIIAVSDILRIAPNAEAFAKLVPGGMPALSALAAPESLAAESVVDMAALLRRDLHKAGDGAEKAAEAATGVATGLRTSAIVAPEGAVTDAQVLRAGVDAAIATQARLREQTAAAELAAGRRRQAEGTLRLAQEQYVGPSAEVAEQLALEATRQREDSDALIERCRQALQEAEIAQRDSKGREREAIAALTAAKTHEADVAAAQQALQESGMVQPAPSDAEVAAADAALRVAREAVEQGALYRQGKAQLDQADAKAIEAMALTDRAEMLRAAAKGTDDVLAELLARACPPNWKIVEGRIAVTEAAGDFYFHDLSDGARGRQAIDVTLDAMGDRDPDGPRVVLKIDQLVCDGLTDQALTEIAAHAERRGINVVGGRIDRAGGELRAYVWPSGSAVRAEDLADTATSPS